MQMKSLLAAILLLAPFAPAQVPTTAGRAQQAIQRRYNEISSEKLDAQGYAVRAELNLIPGVLLEEVRADLEQGTGNELEGKFRAAHSSSALAVNTFGPWRNHPERLSLRGKTGFESLQFERKCPTGLGGFPPNLDVLIEGSHLVIGVESKFLEILAPKQPKFAASYTRENLPRMEENWAAWMDEMKKGPKQYLDAAQLVRHYLGLRNQPEFKGKKIVLLYLFWEPRNWKEFAEYRTHRKELEVFREKVKGSEIAFIWMTYPQLWKQWETLGLYPDHVRELRKRYGLAI